MIAGLSTQSRLPSGTQDVLRKNVFIDTTLFHPAVVRASIDFLGAANVMAGSDFPVAGGGSIQDLLGPVMNEAKLTAEEIGAIAHGNCERLLGLGTPASRARSVA